MLSIPHPAESLIEGVLRARPNRFLAEVELPDGRLVEAHIADRGRLEDILFPGGSVYLAPVNDPSRRTAYSLLLAKTRGGVFTCVQPARASRWVEAAIGAGAVPGVPQASTVRREVQVKDSRLDLEARPPGEAPILIEVKTAVAAKGISALFPDAPSERAHRHARTLTALAKQGQRAMIVFVAPREDVREVRPHPVDPEFARCLAEAEAAGVELRGLGFTVDLAGLHLRGTLEVIAVDR